MFTTTTTTTASMPSNGAADIDPLDAGERTRLTTLSPASYEAQPLINLLH